MVFVLIINFLVTARSLKVGGVTTPPWLGKPGIGLENTLLYINLLIYKRFQHTRKQVVIYLSTNPIFTF